MQKYIGLRVGNLPTYVYSDTVISTNDEDQNWGCLNYYFLVNYNLEENPSDLQNKSIVCFHEFFCSLWGSPQKWWSWGVDVLLAQQKWYFLCSLYSIEARCLNKHEETPFSFHIMAMIISVL